MRIKYLGHASVMVDLNGTIVYFDPVNVRDDDERADMIFITHSHDKHFSISDVNKLLKPGTHLFMPDNTGVKLSNVHIVGEKHLMSIDGVYVLTFPAYCEGHQRGEGVGYVVSKQGLSIYHAGDSGIIPEMKHLKNINVAFLPVSEGHTMSAEQAGSVASIFCPDLVVPIHHHGVVSSIPYSNVLFLKEGELKLI